MQETSVRRLLLEMRDEDVQTHGDGPEGFEPNLHIMFSNLIARRNYSYSY